MQLKGNMVSSLFNINMLLSNPLLHRTNEEDVSWFQNPRVATAVTTHLLL